MPTRVASLQELREKLEAVERRIERETSARSKIALVSERSRLETELVHASHFASAEADKADSRSASGDVALRLRRSHSGREAASAIVGQVESAARHRASPGTIWKDNSDPLADTLSGRRSRHTATHHKPRQDDGEARARKASPERNGQRPIVSEHKAEWRRIKDMHSNKANTEESSYEPKIATEAPQCAVCAHRHHLGLKGDADKTCAACLLYRSDPTTLQFSSRARSSSPVARRLIDRRVPSFKCFSFPAGRSTWLACHARR